MSSASINSKIKSIVIERARFLGNTKKGSKEICSDLVNDYLSTKRGNLDQISKGTFLSVQTLERIRTLKETKSGADYRPASDTCDRIMRFFNIEGSLNVVNIKPSYQNKPKPNREI